MKLYILAGGQSQRMGKPKTEVHLAGKELLRHIIRLTLPIFFNNTIIVSRKNQNFSFNNITIIQDIIENQGPLGGIYTALKHSEEDKIFILSCDLPFLKTSTIEKIINNSKEFDVCVPIVNRNYEPLCGVYSTNCIPAIRKQIDNKNLRVFDFYNQVKLNTIKIDNPKEFLNINDRNDLLKAEKLLREKDVKELPPVISFVGKSNIGKTTFLEKLISLFEDINIKIGVIKHDVHGFDIDKPGKDTYRLKKAGANGIIISSPGKFAVIKDVEAEKTLADLAVDYFSDFDIIFTEGYKQGPYPKIEVFRGSCYKTPLCSKTDNLIAAVSDRPDLFSVTVFSPEQPEECRQFILNFLEDYRNNI